MVYSGFDAGIYGANHSAGITAMAGMEAIPSECSWEDRVGLNGLVTEMTVVFGVPGPDTSMIWCRIALELMCSS